MEGERADSRPGRMEEGGYSLVTLDFIGRDCKGQSENLLPSFGLKPVTLRFRVSCCYRLNRPEMPERGKQIGPFSLHPTPLAECRTSSLVWEEHLGLPEGEGGGSRAGGRRTGHSLVAMNQGPPL